MEDISKKYEKINKYNKFNYRNYIITTLFIISLYFILYFSIAGEGIFSYKAGIYMNILIYVIFAVSLNISVGMMGQLSLGHAGFISIGAYTSAVVSRMLLPHGFSGTILLVISIISGGIIASIFGVLVATSTLRLRGDYLAIITLAFGEIIKYIIQNLDFLGGAMGFKDIPNITTFSNVYFISVISIVIMVMLMTSKYGRKVLSIRENEIAAENIGVNINKTKIYGFALSAFFAGLGGGIFAHSLGILTPDKFTFMFSVEILVMVVLGGLGSITGAVVAATFLTVLNELLRKTSEYRFLIYSLILIILMIFKPTGLLGTKEFTINSVLNKFKKEGDTDA